MPGTVDLAVGTTARLKVFGEYKDGTRVDLTEAAEWVAAERRQGLCPRQPGRGPGPRQFHDRRPLPQLRRIVAYVEAAATVNVAKGDFQSIEVGVDPSTIGRRPVRQGPYRRRHQRRQALQPAGNRRN